MSQSIDWAYWRKLPEVRVFEAIALLHGSEPESDPPEADDSSPEYRKTLRLLLACLSDRSTFTPGTLNMGDPALNGVRLLEVAAWAVANGYMLPEKFPRPLQISKAPPPITPLRGIGMAPSREPSPANWTKWKFIPKCELWKAICLTLDIEPDEEKHGIWGWLQSRRGVPYGFPAEFADRLEIAQANVSTNGPIHPQALYGGVLTNPRAEVLLSEVAAAAIRWEWVIPEAMVALAETAAPVVPESASGGDEWKAKAKARATEIIERQRKRDLYPSQITIADEIAKEFRAAGTLGADGKPLSGAYIKRHALAGISSAQVERLSTSIRRGK